MTRSICRYSWMATVESYGTTEPDFDPINVGPVEALLRQSTTATHRAVNAIRAAEEAKESLHNAISSLTTSFDSTIQKSLALIDRLDESVYSGRIDNAQKRAKIEKQANAIVQQAYSNPIENADLRLFERTVDVLRKIRWDKGKAMTWGRVLVPSSKHSLKTKPYQHQSNGLGRANPSFLVSEKRTFSSTSLLRVKGGRVIDKTLASEGTGKRICAVLAGSNKHGHWRGMWTYVRPRMPAANCAAKFVTI
ncbi:unnamed protein product [Haemonchus placei]|uniref:Mediator of RNA polymerase II transcription subunit 4 n=1 Tax=Haemonchus placei TaxID=6290 RepID=A0A0N4WBZ4_HAEPC|nr:unnamed protein product [Haemonchus placei]